MALEQNRFLLAQQPPAPRRKRWGCCLAGLSCFRKQKGRKRIVPSFRTPETNPLLNHPNGPQPTNQSTLISLSLLAPPSSPASFSHSTLPSTAHSPSSLLSVNSPINPSSTMFATGPYAHDTQLVSPPVFSTFTTEPSTAPLTPPPELAHLTTPSSPEVPYARFLSSSSTKLKHAANEIPSAYSLYPGSPSSALRSPISHTSSTERELTGQWGPPVKEPVSDSGRFLGAANSNFFCPETFAQFYLDQSGVANGRLSISREPDCNLPQNRQNRSCKAEAEEGEAYRASFGFSADDIVTTTNYVEISDVSEDSFSIMPLNLTPTVKEGAESEKKPEVFPSPQLCKAGQYNGLQDKVPQKRFEDDGRNFYNDYALSDDDGIFSKMGASRSIRRYQFSLSNSDAEIEYRRGRSLRERRNRGET